MAMYRPLRGLNSMTYIAKTVKKGEEEGQQLYIPRDLGSSAARI